MKKLEVGVHVVVIPNNTECSLSDLFPRELSGSVIELLDPAGNWHHKETILFSNNQFNLSDIYECIAPLSTVRLNLKRSIEFDWTVKFQSNSGVMRSNLSFQAGFNSDEALNLCQLSDLVYENEACVKETIENHYDYDDCYYFSRKSHKSFFKNSFKTLMFTYLIGRKSIIDLQFMYLRKTDKQTGKDFITIVFRGSQEPLDWMTSMSFKDTKFSNVGNVHQGFYEAFKLFLRTLKQKSLKTDNNIPSHIFDDIPLFNKTTNVILTGHSLGGSLATLAGCYLSERGVNKNNMEIYTFGAPPVGSKEFCEYFEPKISLFRIFNENDVVPKLDKITNLLHFGNEVMLPSNNGEVHACADYIDNIIDQLKLKVKHI